MVYIGIAILWVLRIIVWLLIARMIISWIPIFAPTWRTPAFVAAIFEVIYTLTDPPIRFVGKYVKPLRLGGVSLDLGFMVVFLIVLALQRLTVIFFF
uniref:YggT family protein n=1 Tax=Vaginimicrobium propionicum TaxID=1871034 RepID=UPI000970FF9B|nr:YggT family protein [Vaginimicrobium propionicum]